MPERMGALLQTLEKQTQPRSKSSTFEEDFIGGLIKAGWPEPTAIAIPLTAESCFSTHPDQNDENLLLPARCCLGK
jgi:hypothetical protein